MNPNMLDRTWMESGVSLLWDASALNEICAPSAVRSLREFLRLYQAGWPETELNLVNGRTLVVAGLEAAIDTFAPDEAIEWLEQQVYPALRDYQSNVADGGSEAGLIFWVVDPKRLWHKASDNTHHWHCSGEHRQQSIPIGKCIWNGAERSVSKIISVDASTKNRELGLFLRRIS